MANEYNLILTDGTDTGILIPESQTTDAYGLTFIGRHYGDYGQEVNQNMIYMLQNFASPEGTTPGQPDPAYLSNPMLGQLWYNTTAEALYVYGAGSSFDPLITDNYVTAVSSSVTTNEITMIHASTITSIPNTVINNIASNTEIQAHITDTTAHNASAISFNNAGEVWNPVYTNATNIQDAVEDVEQALVDHLNDATAAHAATAISYNPATFDYAGASPSSVQGAINWLELFSNSLTTNTSTAQTNINNHINDTVDAHDATAISFVNTGTGLSATTVQAAIDEIESTYSTSNVGGMADFVRGYANANQTITSSGSATYSPHIINYNAVLFGDNFSNFNTSTHRYVADRNMLVRVRAFIYFPVLGNDNSCTLRIIRNGATVGRSIKFRQDASGLQHPFFQEAQTVITLNSGQYLEFDVGLQYGSSTSRTLQGGSTYTGFEIEVLQEL